MPWLKIRTMTVASVIKDDPKGATARYGQENEDLARLELAEGVLDFV
jgi:hypothetical protein